MLDSFLLSFFALVFFILAIYSFDKISFEFLSTGKQIRISSSRLILISSLVIVITVLATVFFLNQSSQSGLQYFYFFIFTVSFFLSCGLFFPKSKFWLLVDIFITLLFLLLIVKYQSQVLQNIFMAFGFLWIGPTVLKKLKLKTKYFLIFIVLFLAFDVYNIYFIHPDFEFLNRVLLNGSIIFGGSLLGIGDFFLSYLVINFIQKEVSTKIAIIASVIIASGTLAIYFLYPYINGNIPYSILIVPLTLIIYLVGLKKFNS